MPKFHHWCHLNKQGMKLFGAVFQDGIVPVKVMFAQGATLQGENGIQRVYNVDWGQLSKEQRNAILEILSRKFHTSKDIIRTQFEKDGFIPLRNKYVSGAGTDQMGLFI